VLRQYIASTESEVRMMRALGVAVEAEERRHDLPSRKTSIRNPAARLLDQRIQTIVAAREGLLL
jgi:hypothetical protein